MASRKPAPLEITGYLPKDLLAKTFQDITHPDDLGADLAQLRRMVDNGIDHYKREKRYLRKDGSIVWVRLTVSSVRKANAAIDYFISVVEDISEQKRAEMAARASDERLRLALDAAELGIWHWDLTKGPEQVRVDARCQALFGRSPDAPASYQIWAKAILPEDRAEAKAAVTRALDPADPHDDYACQYRVKHADGKVLWLSARGHAYFEPDRASPSGRRGVSMAGTVRDITEARLAESVRQNEERLRHLGDSLPDSAVYRYGFEPDGAPRFHYISAGIEQMNGVRAEAVLQDAGALLRQVLPEYMPQLIEAERRSADELSDFKMEVPMRRPDGEVRWMRLKSRPQRMPDGRVIWDGIQADVTDRKRAEEALRESEARLRLSNEAGGIGTFTIDLEAGCVHYSPELAAMLGFPAVRTTKIEAAFARVHRDDLNRARAQFEAGLSGTRAGEIKADFRFVRPGGEIRWMTWAGRVHFREEPSGRRPYRIDGACVDITERIRAEEAVRESEEHLRLANEAAGIGTFSIDVGTGAGSYSPELAAMLGYPGAGTAKMEAIFSRIHREDVAWVRARYEAALRGEREGRFKLDLRFVCPGGEVRWVTWAGRVDFREGPSGRAPFRVAGAVVDITERMRAQQGVRESEARLRLSNEAGGIGTFTIDLEAASAVYSPETTAILGYPEARRGMMDDFFKRVHREDAARVIAQYEAALRGEADSFKLDFRFVRPGGEIRWISWAARVEFREAAGARIPIRMVGACVDITESKQAEEAIRASEERLRLATEAGGIGTFTIDPRTGRASYSQKLAAMLGFPEPGTAKLDDVFSRVHREDVGWVRRQYEAALRGRGAGDLRMEFRFVRPGGDICWITWAGRVIFRDRPHGRVPFRVDGVVADITERRRAEEAMARLAAIVTSSSDAIIGKALDGTVTSWNEAAERLFGYSAEEMIGQPVRRLIPPELQSQEDGVCARVAAGTILESYETARLHKSGRLVDVSVTVSPVRNASGEVIGASKIVHDITPRKRAEEALRASEARFRGIFEYAGTGIAITRLNGRIQSCNPAFASMLGYSEDQLWQLDFRDLLYPEDREENLAEIRRLLAQEVPSFEILNRYVAKDGKLVWVHKHVSLLRDAGGKPTHILALVTDMTQRKRHEDRIHLLMREVNHRSKNMLTLVQAIARQTAASKPDDFIERFGERIQALAASQDLLVKNAWKGVNLNELVRSQLAHFEDLIGTRIQIDGPPLLISAPAAQAIGMALHELATNAGKYGALSNAQGRVEIAWGAGHEGADGTFAMSWSERGGPPVRPPSRQGFGSSVVGAMAEMSLNAKVDLDFLGTGLTWRLRCPACEVEE